MKSPTLVYPDPNKPYTLFTDALKYNWSTVLTQEYATNFDDEPLRHQHPITYVSSLFQGNELNWDALTKDVYAIYIAVKKLSFYLADPAITFVVNIYF